MYEQLLDDHSSKRNSSSCTKLLIVGLIAGTLLFIIALICTIALIRYHIKSQESYHACHNQWQMEKSAAYFNLTDKYYIFIRDLKKYNSINSFEVATQKCQEMNGTLVSIHSKEENEFVKNLVKSTREHLAFIGMYRRGSNFSWTDGSEADYSNWNENEPNNDQGIENCGEITSRHVFYGIDEGKWNDVPCDKLEVAVCQVECKMWK